MEVSAGNHVAIFEDKRIVGRRRGLDQQHIFAMRKRATNGAVHLRHTANAVGILHAWIVLAMRFADLAAFKQ